MNTFGILIGILTLLIIGLGFPLVIRGERYFGYHCWPYMMGIGVLIIIASLFISNDWLCAIVGVIGATFVWGSTELKEQAVRAELGWFPFNANKVKVPFADTIKKMKAPHL
ncbi:MAG: DUF4491 domain-containing protein [Chloroflexi bacterium RIFOXYC12_FULL_59_14]|nr:MAG: DUF4491 domain-containing protein [Chloroflexi bacterium RIFOXYD12_FULL_57_15]OGO75200.1 MAG: DUF4491 domain-containing protein [Chloroflexi bacterium RIFOXYC12_FULL_59_14]